MHERLRRNVVFSLHNLVSDGSFNEFHLICCRNVLIYFDEVLRDRVLSLFDGSLARGGYLALGSRESLKFTVLDPAFQEVAPNLQSVSEATLTFFARAPEARPGGPLTAPDASGALLARERKRCRSPFIVALGASLGGLAACREILWRLPSTFPAAIVIAQHRQAESEPILAGLLALDHGLVVTEPDDKTRILAGTCLRRARQLSHARRARGPQHWPFRRMPPVRHARPSIDVLFESVASSVGSKGHRGGADRSE